MYEVVSPSSASPSSRRITLRKRQDNTLSLADFCYYLGTMEKAGVSVLKSLEIAKGMHKESSFKKVIHTLEQTVRQGKTLSVAMESHPRYFNHIFVHLMRLGEQDGKYFPYLFEIENLLRWQNETKEQIQRAVRYPFLLLLMFMGLTFLIVHFLFPEIQGYFTQIGMKELPPSTAFFLKFSQIIEEYSLHGLGAILGLIIIGLLGRSLIPIGFSKIGYHIPFIGPLKWRYDVGWFLNTLGVMLRAKMDILPSLEDALSSVKNPYLRHLVGHLPQTLQQGKTLSQAMRKIPKIEGLALHLIELGEMTGDLAEPILNGAKFQLEIMRRRLQSFTALIEPFLILVMGGLLMWVILAVFWPLYDHMGMIS